MWHGRFARTGSGAVRRADGALSSRDAWPRFWNRASFVRAPSPFQPSASAFGIGPCAAWAASSPPSPVSPGRWRSQPDNAEAYINLGILFGNLGRDEEAIACFGKVIAIAPDNADAHNNLGILLGKKGRYEEAIAATERALRVRPAHAVTAFQPRQSFQGLRPHGRSGRGLSQRRSPASRTMPPPTTIWATCWAVWDATRKPSQVLSRALALKPDFAEAHNNLGVALGNLGRHDEAIVHFRTAPGSTRPMPKPITMPGSSAGQSRPSRIKPLRVSTGRCASSRLYARARARKLHQLRAICDWDALRPKRTPSPALAITGEAVPPYFMLSLEDDPARHLIRASRFAEQYFAAGEAGARPPSGSTGRRDCRSAISPPIFTSMPPCI